jgi:hypothetical protein
LLGSAGKPAPRADQPDASHDQVASFEQEAAESGQSPDHEASFRVWYFSNRFIALGVSKDGFVRGLDR